MAAMPIPWNGILVVTANLPRIFHVSSLNYASLLIPCFNLQFIFIGNGPALSFNKFEMYFASEGFIFYFLLNVGTSSGVHHLCL